MIVRQLRRLRGNTIEVITTNGTFTGVLTRVGEEFIALSSINNGMTTIRRIVIQITEIVSFSLA